MKRTSFFLIVLVAVAVALVACSSGRSAKGKAAEVTEETVTTQPSTSAPAAVAESSEAAKERQRKEEEVTRKRYLSEEKARWQRIQDPRSDWKAEIGNRQICSVRDRFYDAQRIERFLTHPYLPGLDYSEAQRAAQEALAVKPQDVAKLHREAAILWIKELLKVFTSQSPVDFCGEGEGSINTRDRLEIVEEMIRVLAHARLHPKDAGLASSDLRNMLKKALIEKITVMRSGEIGDKESAALSVATGMQEYNFSPQELGLKEEEMKTLESLRH